MHAGRGLLGDAADRFGRHLLVPAGLVLDALLDGGEQHLFLFAGRLG